MPDLSRIYVPVLRWKKGEFDALKNLHTQDRARAIALIELRDDTIDFDVTPPSPEA